MNPCQQFPKQGLTCPCTPRVSPAPPGNNAVIRSTSCTSTPYIQLPGKPGRPPISLPTKRFEQAAELRRSDVIGISDLPPVPDISSDKFDADYESHVSSDLSCGEVKAPISLKEMEFSVNQFAKNMGQPIFSTFNKWNKVWVAGYLVENH